MEGSPESWTAGPVPRPTGDPTLDTLELRIMMRVVRFVQSRTSLVQAEGLALARQEYLGRHPELDGGEADPHRYLSTLVIATIALSPRQQAKILHPSRTRGEAQFLIEGSRI